VTDANSIVRELVRQRVPTMDHVEVLMRLHDVAKPMSVAELVQASRLTPKIVTEAAADLVNERLVAHDPTGATYAYSASREDQSKVEALAALYNQKPVTLVRLVYAQPPSAAQSFADAFRIVDKPGDD
jgi:hypothetical protein